MIRRNDNENLEILKKIGEAIVPTGFTSIADTTSQTATTRQLGNDSGKAFIFGLTHKPGLTSVCDTFITAGSFWDIHKHKEWELMVFYEGKAVIKLYDSNKVVIEEIKIDSNDDNSRFCVVMPEIPHSVSAEEHCSLIAITVPSCSDFPESGVGGNAWPKVA